jgi:protein TonB
MSPHPTTLPPPSPAPVTEDRQEKRVRGSKAAIVSLPDAASTSAVPRRHELFEETLLEMSPTRPRHRGLDIFVSLLVHTVVLTTLVLIPLFFTDAIDLKQFTQMMLVAPPPPPPPPPAPVAVARVAVAPKRVFMQAGKLLAPTAIPEKIAMLKEEALPPDMGAGVAGGVPGGVPGGQLGGVMGGIISGAPSSNIPALPPPAMATPKAPVRVGGRIREPRLITRVDPIYPALARQARMQGDVLIDAVISESGIVAEMKVISGHPLLIPAALEALKKWRYEPTYLNDEPIPVQLLVTVRFRLQ